MQLTKQNIHMDRAECKVEIQFTPEDDIIIPDSKPDVTRILMTDGEVHIDEIRSAEHRITVKGHLVFRLLYASEDSFGGMYTVQGKVPFEEQLNADCITPIDVPVVTADLEHLAVSLINSRKINVQSLILITAVKEELYDEEIATEIESDEPVEMLPANMDYLCVAVMKKDIFRLREELTISASLPNISEILWCNLTIGNLEWKPTEEKLNVKGDLNASFIYRSTDSEGDNQFFEATVPFSKTIDCYGSRDDHIPNITYTFSQREVEIRPDLDGEERIFGIDLVLDLNIKLYEEDSSSFISDVYGINSEVNAQMQDCILKKLISKTTGQLRLTEQLAWPESAEPLLQIKFAKGTLHPESAKTSQDALDVEGYLTLSVLYVTDDDRYPYKSQDFQLPFSYTLDIPGMSDSCNYQLSAELENLSVSSVDSLNIEVKASISFTVFAFENHSFKMINEITSEPLDAERMSALPGITAYFVKEGDTLWDIGKQYYVPVSRIKELNSLSLDTVTPGKKLLIMK